MPKSQSVQRVLVQAKEKEKRYDWLGAVEFHKKALGQVLKQKDFLKAGEIEERIGYCFHRAAMQAESREEFKERMQLAIEEYEKAHGFYEKLGSGQKAARMFRCRAVAKYLGYWLISKPSAKRKLLDECLDLEGKALALFSDFGDMLEYGRTFILLSEVLYQRSVLEWDRQILKSIIERGMLWGQKAVELLTELGDSYEIARAFLALGTVYMCDKFGYYFIAEPEQQEQHRLQAVKLMRNAIDFSEKVADAYVKGLSCCWLGLRSGGEESTRYFQKAIDCGKETRDNYLQAKALDGLTRNTYWQALATEDPDQRRNLADRAMKFYEEAQNHFSILLYQSPRWGALAAPGGYAEHYLCLAEWETDLEKKADLLLMSEKIGIEALNAAEDSDIPMILDSMFHVLSKILEARAKLEPDSDVKRNLLEKAMKHRERTMEITERIVPYDYWSQGIHWGYLARINAELVRLEKALHSKRKLLEEAASNLERSLRLITKVMPFREKMGDLDLFYRLYTFQDSYAMLLNRLYELTENLDCLRKAIQVSTRAIESASKLDMVSLMAESYWRIAKAQDILGEHLEAAKNFQHASERYMKAAEKLPQIKNFYQDHASYMQAWNEIEKAKNYHAKKQYGQAKEHYENTTNLHKSTKRWNYLSPNYLAWARLEEAEDLSRREQTQEAKNLFQQAANLFVEAKKSIQPKLEKIEVTEEKTMGTGLVKASGIRHDYCLGRIALEEAKILDRQGDHTASSRKYGSAAEIFQEIAKAEPEESRKELQPILFLCQAWQKMTLAEEKTSPELYLEASQLFEEAKEHSLNKRTSLLALGNSSFCKALAAGIKFDITLDLAMHSTAKQHIERATTCYLKAGFQSAAEYSKATQRLFDAYTYMNNAEKETDPQKRAKYYQMAEKLLQTSVNSYMKAKHPEKSEEVQRLLENIREERQLAMSLTEVLHVPTIASTTTSFTTPTSTHEKATGLERFEHADIQTNLMASEEVTVGDEVEVRLDLVNVAKESGILIRVDDLVPPSLRVTAPPSHYSIEDGSIDLKGKRLEPLKVESIKLSMQATKAGVVDLRPQIIYVDEVGNFKKCMPEPATITVHPKLTVKFKTEAAQKVFDYLAKSFVEDYMRRRLVVQEAGWRSFVQIIRNAKVSSRSVYGSRGHHGSAISELERRGLIETRIFLGERGRGGKIAKTRISYEKETVKRLVDQKVVKNE